MDLKHKTTGQNQVFLKESKDNQKTYPQNWPLYNLSQTKEKMLFLKILSNSVDSLGIEYEYKGNGRPHYPLDDMIKVCAIKVFNNFSSRRTVFELQLAKALGYIRFIPHFNSINNYMENALITKYLHRLYKLLALPLVNVENNFAVDATGFGTFNKRRWIEVRLDGFLKKDYKKLHIISGVRTNIITSAEVTKSNVADTKLFPKLVKNTSINFRIHEVLADAGYLSRKNCGIVDEVGATPFIMPKKNVSKQSRGVYAWRNMIRFWRRNQELFLQHYHQRSNVESTFSAIKRKFLPYLRSKMNVAQENELLLKVVCHNASVLVNSMFELGINLSFEKEEVSL